MRIITLFIVAIFLVGCATPKPSVYTAHGSEFEKKYISYVNPDEKILTSWYHYLKTEDKDGSFILRTFFPELRQITSEIHCLDKSTKIKDGPAKYWHENGNTKAVGQYEQNIKVGAWKSYHRKSGELSDQGMYENGEKNGLWEYFDSKGRLSSKRHYVNGIREGAFTIYDSTQVIINEGVYKADTIFSQSMVKSYDNIDFEESDEQMPYLVQCKSIEDQKQRNACTSTGLIKHIYSNIKYPPKARKYELEGLTIITFTVTKEGNIEDVDPVISLCQEFKEMNKELISRMPKWEPGMQKGEAVNVKYSLPIRYKLQ